MPQQKHPGSPGNSSSFPSQRAGLELLGGEPQVENVPEALAPSSGNRGPLRRLEYWNE